MAYSTNRRYLQSVNRQNRNLNDRLEEAVSSTVMSFDQKASKLSTLVSICIPSNLDEREQSLEPAAFNRIYSRRLKIGLVAMDMLNKMYGHYSESSNPVIVDNVDRERICELVKKYAVINNE